MKQKNNGEGSARQLKDGSWECIIQSKYINPKTGKPKRIKRKGNTENDSRNNAKRALKIWEKEIENGRDVKIDKTKTFGKYMEEFLSTIVMPTITASGYRTYVNSMHENFYKEPISKYQLQMLNTFEFQKYYDSISEKKARKTCLLPVQLCRRCCTWLVNKSLLEENYAMQAQLKKEVSDEYDKKRDEELKNRKKVFTSEDIQKFYYAYKNNMGQYPVVVLFLLETGMRISEFAALRIDNINFDRNRIDIVETRATRFKDNDRTKGIEYYTKVPKNREARFIMMSDLCRECVLYMIEQTKVNCSYNPDNLLYPTFRNGKRRSSSSMEVCFKELCNKLNIDRDVHVSKSGRKQGLCLHSLRHTADTIANTSAGANVVNTALKMGHKAINVENIYTHATEEALSSVATPSQMVLDNYKINEQENQTTQEELYELYLKLKEKFK